ncbi:MAG: hypothetical protein ACREL5_01705 [Gemmatimonadales bacterium]
MRRRLAIVASIGAILWLLTLLVGTARALTAYLFAFDALATLLVGALLQAMISYLTNARWFALVRRYCWMVVAGMWIVAPLVIALLIGVRDVYPWSRPGVHVNAWLQTPWFVLRTAVYLATWIWLAERMTRHALRQDVADADGMAREERILRRFSAGGVVAVAVTLTFASFDWVMSRDIGWTSTIFGAYLFAGGYLAALALLALLVCAAPPSSPVASLISDQQRAALATMIFMAAILWAYFGFAQLLVIWIGDLPRDARWYAARVQGGWAVVAAIVAVTQFVVPVAALLSRRIKRSRRGLATIAAIVLAGHIADAFWTVVPSLPGSGGGDLWRGAIALVAVGAVAMLAIAARAARFDAIPFGDPDLDAAVAYRRR